ncbi:hypothetical protein K9N68_02325 [Kovacikia minuta CCNUW1]|uniref:hypothetical protein n=1 Tax=Kovacikia minuta TaxID=2931930 RepID=UPI001CCA89D6|nr:hypothetical protein [Kovacikia minuta]UBF26847.1 hypothetical protein K9N68_02325 [Kovacikia minuta CCNUW1]
MGLVLPGGTIVLFLLYVGKFQEVLREMRPLWGLLIILGLALPWYILVTLANGEAFIDSFFGYHNLERFVSVVNRHRGPWYFYFGVVLAGFAPWSLYLPVAIAHLQFWKRTIWCHQPRANQLGVFALVWLMTVFGFFTIAVTKLPSYILPLTPAAAILVALVWSSQTTQTARFTRGMRVSVILNIAFFLLLMGALLYIPELLQGDPFLSRLPSLLQETGVIGCRYGDRRYHCPPQPDCDAAPSNSLDLVVQYYWAACFPGFYAHACGLSARLSTATSASTTSRDCGANQTTRRGVSDARLQKTKHRILYTPTCEICRKCQRNQ